MNKQNSVWNFTNDNPFAFKTIFKKNCGTSSVASSAAAGAVAILGGKTTISAIAIAIAGGGVGILNKLRKYRIEKISDKHIILHKK